MRNFADQRHFNDHVDNAIAGLLSAREIRALIRTGERFTDQTLETEWTLALLRSLGHAPDPEPFNVPTMPAGRRRSARLWRWRMFSPSMGRP
ncbi:MAG: hypothetical protein M0Z85_07545 [Gammaproteobacteria bacterium]|jgi:hypothetical protein|nr:hypothetical protein [Gammaproteobacteria bacterium]